MPAVQLQFRALVGIRCGIVAWSRLSFLRSIAKRAEGGHAPRGGWFYRFHRMLFCCHTEWLPSFASSLQQSPTRHKEDMPNDTLSVTVVDAFLTVGRRPHSHRHARFLLCSSFCAFFPELFCPPLAGLTTFFAPISPASRFSSPATLRQRRIYTELYGVHRTQHCCETHIALPAPGSSHPRPSWDAM